MNVCVFAGRLTADAKSKDVNGTTVASYSVACDSGWGEKKSTLFVNCVHWKPGGALRFLVKGKPVLVRGQLRERKFQDKDGSERKLTELLVAEMEFQQNDKTLENKEHSNGNNYGDEDGYSDDIPF